MTPQAQALTGLSNRRPSPPWGITAGGVHGDLEAARQRLAELVAGHQQALACRGAGGMKLALFRIRLVVLEPVFS